MGEFKKFIDATGYQTDSDKEGFSPIFLYGNNAGVNWLCNANGVVRSNNEYDHPVIFISWNDAVAYCNWLSMTQSGIYRLPTSAEWEFAARGGNLSRCYKYAGSNEIDEVAWLSENSEDKTHPVGQKLPNELGLFDMSGNVMEWCYDEYYYNGKNTNLRIRRGSCWYEDSSWGIAGSSLGKCNDRINTSGFRLAYSTFMKKK